VSKKGGKKVKKSDKKVKKKPVPSLRLNSDEEKITRLALEKELVKCAKTRYHCKSPLGVKERASGTLKAYNKHIRSFYTYLAHRGAYEEMLMWMEYSPLYCASTHASYITEFLDFMYIKRGTLHVDSEGRPIKSVLTNAQMKCHSTFFSPCNALQFLSCCSVVHDAHGHGFSSKYLEKCPDCIRARPYLQLIPIIIHLPMHPGCGCGAQGGRF
jgi:hypothetical protein